MSPPRTWTRSSEVANDKARTLEVAAKPDIAYPKSVPVNGVEDLCEGEAREATTGFLEAGGEVIAQQLATGRKEGASLFIVNGEVLAHCGCIAHRTTPPLGGVSAMRESYAVPEGLLKTAVSLTTTIGVEGPSEVEFPRAATCARAAARRAGRGRWSARGARPRTATGGTA